MRSAEGANSIEDFEAVQGRGITREVTVLGRWLALVPLVLGVLLVCAQLGIASARAPVSADTLSRHHADYSPWDLWVIHPVDPGILEIISQDLAYYAESDGTVPGMTGGEFWPTASSEPSWVSIPPNATPTPMSIWQYSTFTYTPTRTATLGQFLTVTATHAISPAASPTGMVVATTTTTPTATRTSATSMGTPTSIPRSPTPTATRTSGPWWDRAFRYRQRITVAASLAGVPAGYSVSVTFNHAALVTAGKSLSNGNDVRLVRMSGSEWVELHRVLDPLSSWNGPSAMIWFRTVSAVPSSGTDVNYYIYYGNLSAGSPPSQWDNVFLVGDGFNDGTLSNGLSTSIQGAASIVESGGEATLYGGGANADAGVVVGSSPLPGDRMFVIRHKVNHVSGDTSSPDGCCNPEAKLLGIVESGGPPGVADSDTENARRRVIVFHRSFETGDPLHDLETWIFYTDRDGTTVHWDGSGWVPDGSSWATRPLNTYHIVELTSAGTSWSVRIMDAVGNVLTATSIVSWSDVMDGGSPLWFYWGEPYTNAYWADMRSDWFYLRDYVNPEPVTSLGREET